MRQVSSVPGFARVQSLAASVATVAALAALAAIAAAHLAPAGQLAALADTVTPMSGHVLLGTAAVVLALTLRKFQLAILAASVVFALLACAGLGRWSEVAVWPASNPATVRIYALNSWDAHPDLDELERALQAVEADVLVLTEADRRKIPMLERLKTRFPYKVSCAHEAICATAILSRLPIVAGVAARTRNLVPPVAWARIDARARGLGELTVIGTHVHRPTRDTVMHIRQMRALTQMIIETKGPVIVAGDFNAGGWSASFRQLLAATGLRPMAAFLPTWPASPVVAPQVALDHVLVSPDLVFARRGLGPATGSDHLPVFADIAKRTPQQLSAVTP